VSGKSSRLASGSVSELVTTFYHERAAPPMIAIMRAADYVKMNQGNLSGPTRIGDGRF